MALVRFGNGVSEIRGSIAGNTFSRNRAGAIIRNRIKPINPNTTPQSNFRYLFSLIAGRWADLTLTNRGLWNDFGQIVTPFKNRLGEDYQPSGREIFQYCNTNLVIASSALSGSAPYFYVLNPTHMIDAPLMGETEKPPPPTFVNGDLGFTLALTAGAVTTLESVANLNPPNVDQDVQRVIVEATPPLRPAIRQVKQFYRSLASFDASAAADLNLLTPFNKVHPGSYLVGQIAHLRISTVSKSGMRSDWAETEAVAV